VLDPTELPVKAKHRRPTFTCIRNLPALAERAQFL
jgi:hypothetical protein